MSHTYFQNSRGQWFYGDPRGQYIQVGNPYQMQPLDIPPAQTGPNAYGIPDVTPTPSGQPTVQINPSGAGFPQTTAGTAGSISQPGFDIGNFGGNPSLGFIPSSPDFAPLQSPSFGVSTGATPTNWGSVNWGATGSPSVEVTGSSPNTSNVAGSPGSPQDFGPLTTPQPGGATLGGQPDIAGFGGSTDISGGQTLGYVPQPGTNTYDAGNGTTYVYDSDWNYLYTANAPQKPSIEVTGSSPNTSTVAGSPGAPQDFTPPAAAPNQPGGTPGGAFGSPNDVPVGISTNPFAQGGSLYSQRVPNSLMNPNWGGGGFTPLGVAMAPLGSMIGDTGNSGGGEGYSGMTGPSYAIGGGFNTGGHGQLGTIGETKRGDLAVDSDSSNYDPSQLILNPNYRPGWVPNSQSANQLIWGIPESLVYGQQYLPASQIVNFGGGGGVPGGSSGKRLL